MPIPVASSPFPAWRVAASNWGRKPITRAAMLALAIIAGAGAQAATNTFQAGTSWNATGDWTLAHVPTSTDALLFSTFLPATTTLDAAFTADTLSFNTAGTMAIDANASLTTARTLTLNNTTTNANGTADVISLLGGGTINIGVTGSKGVLTTTLVATNNNINVANGGSLVFGTNSIIAGASKALSFTGTSTGMLTLSGANTFSGGLTLTSGIIRATTSTGALGAGTLSLGGGELQLANVSGLNFNRATTVSGNTKITSDVLTSGLAGVTHTLNTLSIGAQTLTVAGGTNVTSGTAGVTFGATTLTGNSTFNVTNPSGGGGTTLTLGALTDGGTTARTITKSGDGTVALGTLASSLIAGTQLIINGGTVNQSATNALGTNNPALSITPTSGTASYNIITSTFTQTIGALTLGGASGTTANITAPGAGKVTLAGNVTFDATNNPNGSTIAGKLDVGTTQKSFTIGDSSAAADDLTVSAVVTNGTSGSILKTGAGTLVLSGASSAYAGGIALNQGTVVATVASALGTSASTVTFGGGSLELRNDTGTTFTAPVNAVSSGGTITVNRASGAATATTHTLGTLALGAQTVSIAPGANITSGTAYGLTFGATTLSGNGTVNIANNGAGTGTLTVGAITDGGNRLTLTGNGNFAQSAAWAAGSGGGLTLGSTFSGIATLNQNNLSTGGTIINGGTLLLGHANGLGPTASATVAFGAGSTGKLQLNGFSPTIIALNSNATVGTPIIENGHGSTASTLTLSTSVSNTFGGVIQNGGVGTLGLLKLGTGSLVLSGANTYTGSTDVRAGSVGVSTIGSTTDASSNLGAGSNVLFLGNSSGTGTLIYTGSGETTDRVVRLNGTSGGGVLDQSGTTGLLKFTSALDVANSAKTLTLQGSTAGTGEFAGVIADSANTVGLNKAGTGTWTLSGANTYTGSTTLTGGTLIANTAAINGSTSTGNLIFNGGTLQAATGGITTSKAVTLNGNGIIDTAGNTVALNGVVTTGTSTLTKNGAGALTLKGNNNLNGGGVVLNAGTLNLNDNSALGNGTGFTGTFTINGGSIDNTSGGAIGLANGGNVWNGDFTFLATRTLDLGVGNVSLGTAAGTTRTITTNGGVNQALTVGGVISNGTTANSLTKAGTGALTLNGNNTYTGLTTVSAGTLTLAGANTGAGGVKVDGGTLIIGNTTGLGTGALTMNGGTVDVAGAKTISNAQVWNGDFTFGGSSDLTLTAGTVSLGSAAGTSRTINLEAGLLTVNGVIANGTTATALVKTGNGDMDLKSANTFTGGLTFGSGTLWISNAGALGTGVFTINNGAILDNYFAAGITTTNNGLVINGDFTSLGRQSLLSLGSGTANLGTAPGTTRTITAEGGNLRVLAINSAIADGTTATGIIKAGIGDLNLGGNNTFTGGLTLMDGRLNINNAGALGTGTFTFRGGSIANSSGAAITNANNNAQIWDANVLAETSTANNSINLGTGTVSLGSTSTDTVRTINAGANTAGTLTVGGSIQNGTNGVTTGLTTAGAATLTLNGNNTYTGTTTVTNGTANFRGVNSGGGAVVVTGNVDTGTFGTMNVAGSNGQFTQTTDYTVTGGGNLRVGDSSSGLANRLNPNSSLTLGTADGSGTFTLLRGSATANSQSFVSLNVGDGSNTITTAGSGGANHTLTFSGANPYHRDAGGFLNFAPSSSTSALAITFANAPSGAGNVASGLLVGATLNGIDFVRAQAGTVTAVSYTDNTWASGNQTNVTATNTIAGGSSTGSLRFNTGAFTLTLAGTNTIESGGLIVGSSATSAAITGGNLRTGIAGGDLWIYTNTGKTLSVDSTITDNAASSLSVGGGGTVTLKSLNTYAGRTTVGSGTTLNYDNNTGAVVNNVAGSGTLRNINTSGPLTLNQTLADLSLGTVGGVSGSTVIFNGTGDTTVKNTFTTAGQNVRITGGTVTIVNSAGSNVASNVLVNGGILNVKSSLAIVNASGSQTLDVSSGQLNALGHVFIRANGNGATFTANQTGGTFSTTGVSQLQLGLNTATTSTSTYNLSGGTLRVLGSGGLILYADPTGISTTTFNLSGGTLLNLDTIIGNQGTGAKQAFVWTGGTLATFGYDATKLTSTAGTAVSGSTNALTNGGGILAPGGIGTAGKTAITGKYQVSNPNASLAIDIGGSSAATAFQQSNRYDVVAATSTATLDGKLLVSLIGGFTPSALQQYTILTASGGVSGTFTNVIADAFSDQRVVLADGLASFTIAYGATNVVLDNYFADNEWYGNGTPDSATWSDPTNWSVFLPSLAGHTAKFADNGMSGAQDVVLDSDLTIGGVQFNNTTSQYTITSSTGNGLTLDNNGSASTISVTGSHTIAVPTALANDLTVSTTGSTYSLDIAGAVSGTDKTLTKTGDGTLILSGNNTYTGATVISGGILQIGNGGITGSVAGDIVNNAQLVFNRSDVFTFAGVISGSGSVLQQGEGTLTLTAANSYTGGTTVAAGTLATGATGNFGEGDIHLLAGATLTLGNAESIANTAWLFFDANSIINLNSAGVELLGGLQQDSGSSILSGIYTAAQLNQRFGGSVFNGLGSLQIGAIPEPATWTALAGLAVGLFAVVRRRRGKTTTN